MPAESLNATGRRKTAIARVSLFPGDGSFEINERPLEEYFPTDSFRACVLKPLIITEKQKSYSVHCSVRGGGIAAQAGAVAHGISRALLKVDATQRSILKKEGLLTRDSRMKERKKYGQKGARKRFQYSKR